MSTVFCTIFPTSITIYNPSWLPRTFSSFNMPLTILIRTLWLGMNQAIALDRFGLAHLLGIKRS